MNTSAIALMIFAMASIWGGLIFAIIHLIKNPDLPMEEVDEALVPEDRAVH